MQYKYKLFSDATKTIRGTYLGPTFGKPVQHFQVIARSYLRMTTAMKNLASKSLTVSQVLRKKSQDNDYMVFATDREIGLQSLPLDGNPYKIVSVTGHPQKVKRSPDTRIYVCERIHVSHFVSVFR